MIITDELAGSFIAAATSAAVKRLSRGGSQRNRIGSGAWEILNGFMYICIAPRHVLVFRTPGKYFCSFTPRVRSEGA